MTLNSTIAYTISGVYLGKVLNHWTLDVQLRQLKSPRMGGTNDTKRLIENIVTLRIDEVIQCIVYLGCGILLLLLLLLQGLFLQLTLSFLLYNFLKIFLLFLLGLELSDSIRMLPQH